MKKDNGPFPLPLMLKSLLPTVLPTSPLTMGTEESLRFTEYRN